MSLITYEDKVALNENPQVANINKVTANDMNQIKNAINNLFPVGFIISVDNAEFNPNTSWGGTWERLKGRVIVGVDEDDTDLNGDTDIIVRSLNQPNCTKVNIDNDGVITFDVEKELGVEIVGETKVKISVEEDEEPWDEVEDEVTEEDLKDIDNTVKEDYI